MNKIKITFFLVMTTCFLSCSTGKRIAITGNVITYPGFGFYRMPLEYEVVSNGELKELDVLIFPNGKMRGKLKLNDSINIKCFASGGYSCVPALINEEVNINEVSRKIDLGDVFLYNRPDLSVSSGSAFAFNELSFELFTDIEDISYYKLSIYLSSSSGSSKVEKILEIDKIIPSKFNVKSVNFEDRILQNHKYYSNDGITYTFFHSIKPGYYMVRADLYREVEESTQLVSYSGVNFFEIKDTGSMPSIIQD